MTREEVVALMESSKSEDEWNQNSDKVKRACRGYPDFWIAEISEILNRTSASWDVNVRSR